MKKQLGVSKETDGSDKESEESEIIDDPDYISEEFHSAHSHKDESDDDDVYSIISSDFEGEIISMDDDDETNECEVSVEKSREEEQSKEESEILTPNLEEGKFEEKEDVKATEVESKEKEDTKAAEVEAEDKKDVKATEKGVDKKTKLKATKGKEKKTRVVEKSTKTENIVSTPTTPTDQNIFRVKPIFMKKRKKCLKECSKEDFNKISNVQYIIVKHQDYRVDFYQPKTFRFQQSQYFFFVNKNESKFHRLKPPVLKKNNDLLYDASNTLNGRNINVPNESIDTIVKITGAQPVNAELAIAATDGDLIKAIMKLI